MDETTTLARKLGITEHVSPLLWKARKLGMREAKDLEALAIQRGCTYYGNGQFTLPLTVSRAEFSDAELATSLLHASLIYHPQNIRLGAAMLASPLNSPANVAWLAETERCEIVIRAIANAGIFYEPQNPYWQQLLSVLPECPPPKAGVLPHRTRYVAMTGFTRRGSETVAAWIRPY